MNNTKTSRRIRRALVALGAITIAVGALGAGLASAGDNGHHSFRMRAERTSESVLPLGQEPSQVGDEFVDHWTVSGSKGDGTLESVCQVTASHDQAATIQCVSTLSLHDGQLAAQGVGNATEAPTGNDFTFAVTGGTGTYRGARGEIRIHQVSDTVSDFDVALAG